VSAAFLLSVLAFAQPYDGGADPDAGRALQPIDAEASTGDDAAPDNHEATEVAAPSGILHGRVLAKGSRTRVIGAQIIATDGAGNIVGGESDDEGQFELRLPCGPQHVRLASPGFEIAILQADACAEAPPLVVRLRPRAEIPVYETVVTGTREEPNRVVERQALTTTPGSLGDPLRIIESLPGVATVAWPAPIYAIRGSNPGNTGYFLDDVQIPMLFHLALGPSVIHPYFFDSMAFYPGGYPARYGRYVAGIVTARTRAPAEDSVHASVEARLYDAGALVSAPWPDHKGGVAVAFRYSYTGTLLGHLQDQVQLSYWDYQVRADRRIGGLRLSLLVMGSSDDLAYDLSSYRKEYAIHFHRAGLRLTAPLGSGLLYAHVSGSSDHSQAPIQGFPISVDALSLVPRVGYELHRGAFDLDIGADGQVQHFAPMTRIFQAEPSGLGSKRTVWLGSAYASATIRAGTRLTLTPGLRFDSYTIAGATRHDLGPRLSVNLAIAEETWLVASGGRFSQAPSLAVQIPGAENFGLALYGLQTSWQAALGLRTRRWLDLELETTGFLQRYVLTDRRDPTLKSRDPLMGNFLVQRDARAYGFELMLRRPEKERLHGWLSYTLSRSERALGGRVVGPSDWDQTHIVNAVLGYRVGRNILGTRLHVNTGRPVLLQGDAVERFQRLPTFYQLDLRAERRLIYESFTLSVYAEVVNATMTRTVVELDQDPMTKQVTERSYRLLLPSIGLRGEL
jgi:hypothetical protein